MKEIVRRAVDMMSFLARTAAILAVVTGGFYASYILFDQVVQINKHLESVTALLKAAQAAEKNISCKPVFYNTDKEVPPAIKSISGRVGMKIIARDVAEETIRAAQGYECRDMK